MQRNTRGWGMAGALVALAGAALAMVMALLADDLAVAGLDPPAAGALLAGASVPLRLAGIGLALTGIGTWLVTAIQRAVPCEGAVPHIVSLAGGAAGLLYVVAASVLFWSDGLAATGHLPVAAAAFQGANLVAWTPAGVVYATHAGASACLALRAGGRVAMVLAAVATLAFLVLAGAQAAAWLEGALMLAWPAWLLVAAVTTPRGGA